MAAELRGVWGFPTLNLRPGLWAECFLRGVLQHAGVARPQLSYCRADGARMLNHDETSAARRCRVSGSTFLVSEAELDILDRLTSRNPYFGEPFSAPDLSPAECVRRCIGFANLRYLFHAKSCVSGQSVLTRYNPLDGYRTSTVEEFWTDQVDNTAVGRPYDFHRPFFVQLGELMRDVVHIPLNNSNCESSAFVNGARNVRRCYLCFSVVDSEDCFYCVSQYSGTDNVLCVGTNRCRYCYAGVDIDSCYECQHCSDCDGCNGCFGCVDCRSCESCVGCVGLERARFCVFNKQLTEQDYRRFMQERDPGSWRIRQVLLADVSRFVSGISQKPSRMIAADGCNGSYIRRSHNLSNCYHSAECRDCSGLVVGLSSQDCWKGYAVTSELCYNSGVVSAQNVAYSYGAWDAESVWYCYNVFGHCRDCFGCAALRGNSYCILNKQYSKSEYFELLPRIAQHMKSTGEWGEFPHPSIAPHSYEESWIPNFMEDIDIQERVRRGYRSREPQIDIPAAAEIDPGVIPDHIAECDVESLAGSVLRCPESGQRFNLQKRELEFYLRFSIPVPRLHWSHSLTKLIAGRDRMPDDVDGAGLVRDSGSR